MSRQKTIKQRLLSVPLLGRILSVGSNVVHLPQNRVDQEHRLAQINASLDNLAVELKELRETAESAAERTAALQTTQDNIQKQLSLIEKSNTLASNKPVDTKSSKSELFADDHMLDIFYTNFEDKFRGDEASIEEKLEIYLPYFSKKSKINYSEKPVLDIGSGRGEFLRLLKKNKIKAKGLDINLDMVERANKNGLETIQGDALEFLSDSKNQTYGAITGFHIVEHIPFPLLLKIFSEAHRALATDGFVIFETPNPENVVVGTSTFYLDPSHLKPIPPLLLAFALETAGFRKTEILRLHADDSAETKGIPQNVAKYLYGPRDYAVIAYK